MDFDNIQRIDIDVLVIGGGAAGLRAAIAARKHGFDVLVACYSPAGFKSNTAISKATIAANAIWKGPGDSPEIHSKDTIEAGRLLNDQKLVNVLTHGVNQQIHDLIEMGVKFKQRDGEILVGKAPGHSFHRQVSAEAAQGVRISRAMREFAMKNGVKFAEGVLITRLLKQEGRVVGATGIDINGNLFIFAAKSTILATGGAGEVYLRTNNVPGSTGDGYALAYEAGAVLRDMEFVQFYPTTFGKHSQLCMYEWYMPHGATLKNSRGDNILERHGITIAQATRDVLTRIIMEEIVAGRGVEGSVVFDLTAMDREKAERTYRGGLQGNNDRFLVAPTVHFFMGGVVIDENTGTGIPGLYAAGEVSGGLHGANRLGGNALGETFTFGTIAGDQAAQNANKLKSIPTPQAEISAEIEKLKKLASGKKQASLDSLRLSLKQTMWDKVGVIRNKEKLEKALEDIAALRQESAKLLTTPQQLPEAIKLRNMLTVSEMVCRSALMRTESRGAHYRADYPGEDNEKWLKTIRISSRDGEMTLHAAPLSK